MMDSIEARKIAIEMSVKYLRGQGYDIEEKENGQFDISVQIFRSIEADIKALGWMKVAGEIFQPLSEKYCHKQERYHLIYPFRAYYSDDPRLLPCNYLLNLCVKNLDNYIYIPHSPSETWNRLVYTSTALAALYDGQFYNQFELQFKQGDDLIKLLQRLILHDGLFKFPQLRPSDVPSMLRGLFSFCNDKVKQKLGWSTDEAALVVEVILELAKENQHIPLVMTFDTIFNAVKKVESNIVKDSVQKILNVYYHSSSQVNQGYQLPTDQNKTSNYFGFKPLIKLSNQDYVLMNASWCSPNFYEAIVSCLREEYDKKINDKIGKEGLENFVKDKLKEKSVSFLSGEYKKGKVKEGECDVVIETKDTIIFIETKTKPLTRKAKDGNQIALFFDLIHGFLQGLNQINQHEEKLLQEKCINFEDGSQLDLNGRSIEKVVLTLLDYGSFQSRTIIREILKNWSCCQYDTFNADQKTQEKFKKVTEELTKFQEKRQKVQSDESKTFINCWFLSLPQLLIILDDVNSNESFKDVLYKTRHMNPYLLDFYIDHSVQRLS